MERLSPQSVAFFENTTLRRVDLPTQNMIFWGKTIKWKVKSSNFYKMIAVTTSFYVSLTGEKHAKLRPGRDRYRWSNRKIPELKLPRCGVSFRITPQVVHQRKSCQDAIHSSSFTIQDEKFHPSLICRDKLDGVSVSLITWCFFWSLVLAWSPVSFSCIPAHFTPS